MTSNSSSSILDAIQHYQRNIDRSQKQNDEQLLLHCINKLYKMPVKVEHLQETGVGKTVNSLRKFNGEIGVAAKALVTKWKAMVAAEEEKDDVSMETTCQSRDGDNNNNRNGDRSSDDEQQLQQQEQHNINSNHKLKQFQIEGSSSKSVSSNDKSKHKHHDKIDHHHQSQSVNSSRHDQHHSSKKGHSKDSQKSKESHRHTDHNSSSLTSSKEKHRSEKDDDSVDEEDGGGKKRSSSSSHHRSSHSKKHDDDKSHRSKHHSSKERSGHNREQEKAKHKDRSSEKSYSTSSSSKDNSKISKKEEGKQEKPHQQSSSTSKRNESSEKSNLHLNAERKRRFNSDNDSANDGTSPEAKISKLQKNTKIETEKTNDADDGIDSSTGANFADVLGMLNMPTKKSKKSLQNLATTTTTSSGSSSSVKNNISSTSKEYSTSKTSSQINGLKSSTSKSASSSKCSPTIKPDLLSSTAKLEPLDPSIALELPTISNNYKPMPLNQTVMDCVFNTSTSSSSKTPAMRTLTDAEALSHGISSKTMRTKIYSGVKTGQKLQVPTLFNLCIRVLQKNIDALEYTGGVPFEVLRPVLERATPQQLLMFEEYNPYVMEDSDVLWQLHLQRNYRNQKRQEMETWREMYLRCLDEEERRLNILAENIKQSQKITAAPVRKTQLAFVDSLVKPPRNVQRKQEQFGTKGKLAATPAARVAALSSVTPNAAKVGDVRLRVAAGVRDAAQISHVPIRPKKAPLMAKTLQLMRGRHKR